MGEQLCVLVCSVEADYGVQSQRAQQRTVQSGGMTYDEATKILQETFQREKEHKEKVLDRRRRRGEIIEGEQLTHAEKNARMLAFL